MKGDFSRLRFSPNKNYTSVLQQQGRVSLDADSNEQCAINDYLRTTETVDVVGTVGGPIHDEGFQISVVGDAITIGAGRYYVDGILCENEDLLYYADQPYLINPNPDGPELLAMLREGSISAIQLYLQAWRRLVTDLDDPCLREPAIGQADTTARLQTVWRVIARTVAPPTRKPLTNETSVRTSELLANATETSTGLADLPTRSNCCASMDTGPVLVRDPGAMSAQTSGGTGNCSCQPTPAALAIAVWKTSYTGLKSTMPAPLRKQPLSGLGKMASWSWRLRASPAARFTLIVSARTPIWDSLQDSGWKSLTTLTCSANLPTSRGIFIKSRV